MNLFVKRFHKCVKKNEIKFSDKSIARFHKQSSKSKGVCYECGKFGHYKSDCQLLNKDKETSKSFKNGKKNRRTYVSWNTSSEFIITN
jgi:hypothetical protein